MAEVPRRLMVVLGLNVMGDLGGLTSYTNRNRKLIIFPRAPPLNPPTIEQIWQRQRMVAAARQWKELTIEQRRNWLLAARRASLKITGYNLFVYWSMTNDAATVRTIERQSGFKLL